MTCSGVGRANLQHSRPVDLALFEHLQGAVGVCQIKKLRVSLDRDFGSQR